jgi:hypothetical protein
MRREISAQAQGRNMTMLFYAIITDYLNANYRRRPLDASIADLLRRRERRCAPRRPTKRDVRARCWYLCSCCLRP